MGGIPRGLAGSHAVQQVSPRLPVQGMAAEAPSAGASRADRTASVSDNGVSANVPGHFVQKARTRQRAEEIDKEAVPRGSGCPRPTPWRSWGRAARQSAMTELGHDVEHCEWDQYPLSRPSISSVGFAATASSRIGRCAPVVRRVERRELRVRCGDGARCAASRLAARCPRPALVGQPHRQQATSGEPRGLRAEFAEPRTLELDLDSTAPLDGLLEALNFALVDDVGLVGISCWTSMHYLGALAVAGRVRALRPDLPIVVGGHHATAAPDDFDERVCDVVVTGDGERAPRRLCRERPQRSGRCDVVVVLSVFI